ncbi:MAG: hypothetical protein ABR616_09980 [Dermatophilaceae bacterium]
MIVVGIDPGGRNTGAVVRQGETLLAWQLIVRRPGSEKVDGTYLRNVLGGVRRIIGDAGIDPADADAYEVAVETVAYWPEPRGSKVRRNQQHLYGTAMVLGAVLARWPRALVVDSGRGVANYHPQSYPEQIRPPVNGAGKDRLNHVRAAWDHSHAGETLAHVRNRSG